MVDDLLAGRGAFAGLGNPYLSAINRARGLGMWLAPDVLAPHLTATTRAAQLAGAERIRFESEHSFQLHQEAAARRASEGLRAWAAADTDAIERDATAKRLEQEHAEFVARRVEQLRIDDELVAAQRRRERAEREWNEMNAPKPAPKTTTKKGSAHA